MAFDPFDPFGNLTLPDAPANTLRRVPPLKKDEEESLLSQLTGKVLGGVGYLGGALDKPGRAVRGLLGGKPEEALNLIPFSDALGITHEQNRVSGEDLLKQWGVLEGEGEKGTFELRDLAGPALEMGLDPFAYASFAGKAVSKGGELAKRIGVKMPTGGAGRASTTLRAALEAQPELQQAAEHGASRMGLDLASHLDQPLGGHVGVGLPFGGNAATFDLSPALNAAGAIAGHIPGAGYAKQAAEAVAPYGRAVGALFHKPWQGAAEPVGAEVGKNYTENLRKIGVKRTLQEAEAIRMGHAHDLLGPNAGDEIGAIMEKTLVGPPRAGAEGVANLLSNVNADELQRMRAAGYDVSTLDDIIGYRPRQQTQLLKDTKGFVGPGRSQAVPTYTSAMEGRLDAFKGLPGGTHYGLNPLLSDPEFSGIASKVAQPDLQNRLLQNAVKIRRNPALINLPAEEEALLATLPKEIAELEKQHMQIGVFGSPDDARILATDIAEKQQQLEAIKAKMTKSQELAKIAAGVDPQYAEPGAVPFFGNHPIADTFKMAAAKDRAIAGSEAITDLIGRTATDIPKPGAVQINKALEQLGLSNLPAAQQNVMRSLGKYGKQLPVNVADQTKVAFLQQEVAGATTAESSAMRHAIEQDVEAMRRSGFDPSQSLREAQAGIGARLRTPDEQLREMVTGSLEGMRPDYEQLGRSAGSPAEIEHAVRVERMRHGIGEPGDPLDHFDLYKIAVAKRAWLEKHLADASSALQGVPDSLMGQYIPGDVMKSASRYGQSGAAPDALRPLLDVWDSFTNLFKTGSYGIWPASHARNAVGADFMNAVKGAWGLEGGRKASALLSGAEIPGAAGLLPELAGLTDREATNRLADLAMAHLGLGGHLGQAAEAVGPAAEKALASRVPGLAPESWSDLLPKGLPTLQDVKDLPKIRGVGGYTQTVSKPAQVGVKVGEKIESQKRLAGWLNLLEKGYTPEQAAKEMLAAHGDYQNLTNWERGVMRRLVPFYCVPDHAEILTRDGWKSCDDLVVGEEVLTYNMADDVTEWQPCLDKAIFDHDQPLLNMTSEKAKVSLDFTPEHRWCVEYTTHVGKPRGFQMGKDLGDRRARMIVAAPLRQTESLLTPKQARLLGWLVTDGSCRKKGNYTEAVIYQTPHKFLQEVIEVAGGKPRKSQLSSGTICVPVLKERKEEILEWLDKGKLVSVVTRLSHEAASAMYDAMYKADGGVSPSQRGDFFAKEDDRVLDAFRLLAFFLGKRTTRNKRGSYISNRRHFDTKCYPLKEKWYTGRVWCPQTANGTWVMRQNEIITITGNSWQRQVGPEVLRELAQNPGGLMGQTMRASNDFRQQAGFVPNYVGQGMAVPVGKEDDGTQRYLSGLGLPHEQVLDLLKTGPQGPENTLMGLLGQMNPLIKAPLEYATGKQFFTGRDLEDLHTITGNTAADQLVMNSPASRFYTSGRTLLDERKDWPTALTNLLTGAKFTDVDMDKARNVATRDLVDQLLTGEPGVRKYTELYVKPEDMGKLSERDLALLRLNRTMEEEGRKRAREAKKRVGVKG